MIMFLLLVTKWYFVAAAISLVAILVIVIHDKYKYGVLIENENMNDGEKYES